MTADWFILPQVTCKLPNTNPLNELTVYRTVESTPTSSRKLSISAMAKLTTPVEDRPVMKLQRTQVGDNAGNGPFQEPSLFNGMNARIM